MTYDVRKDWVKLMKSCLPKVYAIHPKNFDTVPCASYKELNNKDKADNFNDNSFNPLNYDEVEYENTYWGKSITEVVNMIKAFDNAMVNEAIMFKKTYTSPDMYDGSFYYKVVRYKAIVDNYGNVYTGI